MPSETKRRAAAIGVRAHFSQREGDRLELWKLERVVGVKGFFKEKQYEVHPAPVGINPVFVASKEKAREVEARYPGYTLVRA